MQIEYWSRNRIKGVTVLPRHEQKKCRHIYRNRVNKVAGWRYVCQKCGTSAR